ncbi:hypothetical protein ANN_08212 [Periplaneta americana]|uniref:Uncharacterized protein n=1 Tax=Periplaneta americana TaxID=6978 RepID=A0ABQ8T0S8_PERAM|nr:hypothetical protein ANN_08212 [Periplaneta americana]
MMARLSQKLRTCVDVVTQHRFNDLKVTGENSCDLFQEQCFIEPKQRIYSTEYPLLHSYTCKIKCTKKVKQELLELSTRGILTKMYWDIENPHVFHEDNTQFPQKIDVWAGIFGDDIVGPIFIEGNLMSTTVFSSMNKYDFCSLLKGSGAVASWSKTSCLGLALRNAR